MRVRDVRAGIEEGDALDLVELLHAPRELLAQGLNAVGERRGKLLEGLDVGPRHDHRVPGPHRRDVEEGDDVAVLVDADRRDLSRDDPAENAARGAQAARNCSSERPITPAEPLTTVSRRPGAWTRTCSI